MIDVSGYICLPTALHEVQRMGPCHLIAGPYAPSAQDAAVMVHNYGRMRGVSGLDWPGILIPCIVHLVFVSEVLQFTVTAGHTISAEMVAFCE